MSPARSIVVAALAASALLTGCITGDRPTLAEVPTGDVPTGDPATDAVLGLLAAGEGAVFTAGYDVTNNFGPLTRSAVVVQDEAQRRSVTIGDVRFLIDSADAATCNMVTAECTTSIDDAAVSDMQVTHQFYGRSAAERLHTDSLRRTGATEASTAEFAGVPATGVSVPVAGGNKVYCATDAGVLASYQGPDVTITLTSYSDTPDGAAFDRPT
jgi:hypothetical protein